MTPRSTCARCGATLGGTSLRMSAPSPKGPVCADEDDCAFRVSVASTTPLRFRVVDTPEQARFRALAERGAS